MSITQVPDNRVDRRDKAVGAKGSNPEPSSLDVLGKQTLPLVVATLRAFAWVPFGCIEALFLSMRGRRPLARLCRLACGLVAAPCLLLCSSGLHSGDFP
jgi:hypothetical protein